MKPWDITLFSGRSTVKPGLSCHFYLHATLEKSQYSQIVDQ
jgi:hypothetical protein